MATLISRIGTAAAVAFLLASFFVRAVERDLAERLPAGLAPLVEAAESDFFARLVAGLEASFDLRLVPPPFLVAAATPFLVVTAFAAAATFFAAAVIVALFFAPLALQLIFSAAAFADARRDDTRRAGACGSANVGRLNYDSCWVRRHFWWHWGGVH